MAEYRVLEGKCLLNIIMRGFPKLGHVQQWFSEGTDEVFSMYFSFQKGFCALQKTAWWEPRYTLQKQLGENPNIPSKNSLVRTPKYPSKTAWCEPWYTLQKQPGENPDTVVLCFCTYLTQWWTYKTIVFQNQDKLQGMLDS